MNKRLLSWFIAVPAGLALIASIYLFFHPQWIAQLAGYWKELGPRGLWMYGALYVGATVFLVPCSPFILAAGFLFGVVKGSILMSAASTASATISFLFARFVARDWAARKLARFKVLAAFDQALQQNGFKVVVLMWLQPVFIPFVYLNLGLGVTQVRLRDFILGTWVGMLPGIILYVYVGSLVRDVSELSLMKLSKLGQTHSLMLWLGFVATVLLVTLLTRLAKQSLQATTTGASPELAPTAVT